MGVQAIDNTNLLNYRDDLGTTGFVPAISFEWDAVAKEVDFTDNSTFPSGVALKIAHVRVHDKKGGEARGYIAGAIGSPSGHLVSTTVDISTLDPSEGLDITATVIADDDKLVADGGAYNIIATGDVGSWDKQKNA